MAKSKTSKTKIQSVTEPKDAPKIRSEVISIFDKLSVWQGFGLLWGCVLLISVILFKDYLFHKKYPTYWSSKLTCRLLSRWLLF